MEYYNIGNNQEIIHQLIFTHSRVLSNIVQQCQFLKIASVLQLHEHSSEMLSYVQRKAGLNIPYQWISEMQWWKEQKLELDGLESNRGSSYELWPWTTYLHYSFLLYVKWKFYKSIYLIGLLWSLFEVIHIIYKAYGKHLICVK